MDDHYQRQLSEDSRTKQKFLKYLGISCFAGALIYTLSPSVPKAMKDKESSYDENEPKSQPTFLQQSSISNNAICKRGLGFWRDQDAVETIWNNIPASGQFTDDVFPASEESLFFQGYVNTFTDGISEDYAAVKTWKRPSDLVQSRESMSSTIVSLSASDESCNLTDCSDYNGFQSKTTDGRTCVPWSAKGSRYASLESNYCRNPDGASTIWCFVSTESMKWKSCEPLPQLDNSVQSCVNTDCSDYSGTQSTTKDGRTCVPWSTKGSKYAALESNYCRNPDGANTIWCFISPDNMKWKYCEPTWENNDTLPEAPVVDQNTCEDEYCSDYRGTLAITQNGLVCDQWSTDHYNQYPDGGLASNYCRNPDNDKQLWCRTSQATNGWDYCENLQVVPNAELQAQLDQEKCEEDDCSDYRGKQSTAINGQTCLEWSSKGSNYGGKVESNYCRNPDGDRQIWCFTSVEGRSYTYCEPIVNYTPGTHFLNASGRPSLWGRKGILPSGVRQGSLGDCWFLAVGAALAEHPQRLRKLFVNTEYPENGAFRINFFAVGKQVSVIVDDQLPLNPTNEKKPINNNVSKNGAWWMPILEKAYAKFNVFYANMDGGNTMQSIRDLTGMPVTRYNSQQTIEELFRVINEVHDKNWIAIGSCKKSLYGLTSAHAYTMMGVLKLTDDSGKEWNFVQMRNPWGSENYNGDWHDKDPRWTDELKAQVGHKSADDGIFLLPVEVFHEVFTAYTVGMYQDWKVSQWSNQNNSKRDVRKFSSTVDQDAYLTLDWMAERRYPRAGCEDQSDKSTEYYNLFMKNISTGEEWQESCYNSLGYCVFKFEGGLKAGEEWSVVIYDFGFEEQWNEATSRMDPVSVQEFTVSLYADLSEVQFEEM